MKISYRQAKRIWSRYQIEHDIGLVHKSRGKPSARSFDQNSKKIILQLYQEKYFNFGATFAVEKLAEEDNYILSSETLRQWLKAEQICGFHAVKGKVIGNIVRDVLVLENYYKLMVQYTSGSAQKLNMTVY